MNHKIKFMRSVEKTFRDAFNHVESNIPDPKRKSEVQQFAAGISLQYSMYMAFTTAELPNLIDRVFRSESVRDFVFRLTTAFQARLGHTKDEGNELVKILAQAMTFVSDPIQGKDEPTVALPEQIKTNLPTYEDVLELLENNTWLVTLVMINLYLQVEVPGQK